MATSIRETSRRLWLRFAQFLITRTPITVRVRTMRAAIFGGLVVGVMVYAPVQNARLRSEESSQDCPQPGAKVDLAFIIDSSGSLDVKAQGQTYNVEIEGVRRAILDASLIPRDASIAVAVFTFAGAPSLRVPFTEIKSEADAVAVAAKVEALKCVTAETCPLKGPNRETNAGPALLAANQHLSDNQRAGARRVLLMSTDGGFTDDPFFEVASSRIREETSGIASEVDVILLGLFANPQARPDPCPPTDAGELDAAKARVRRIVFPEPDTDLPGARLDISVGACNCPNAVFGSDCERQVRDSVELTRRVLRSQPATRPMTVNTVADTAPDTAIGNTLSLRQAIERANSTGGATTITFAPSLEGKTIRLGVPLPALTAPDIRICGCADMNCDYLIDPGKKCEPFLTIDGIDTTKGNSDGIVIRSDRAVVRGLKIINFAGAGVSIEPICNRGFSRIEHNRFENNKKAGVRILDSTANRAGAASHNVGNTISMNDILGSETPIDLAGEGPTTNDPGDPDAGPNTLLNFPDSLSVADTLDVTATASGVSLSGQVNGPTAAGATVEIFAITSFRPAGGGRVIDGVTFLKQATANANGSFTVTGLADSPTCGYTATVTDLAGNTSELMFPCAGFPRVKVTNPEFRDVSMPNGNPQNGTFSIENTGCSPLVLRFDSIRRNGFSGKRGNDLAHFSIESIIVGPNGHTLTIPPGQPQTFTAKFDPAIPVLAGNINPPASLLLPEMVNSTITLTHNGCSLSDGSVALTARVNPAIKLIDPTNTRNDPLVTLERSGDVFTVNFSVYDSNQDVERVEYQFFDNGGGTVSLEQPDRDLGKRIQELKMGQSFTVRQTFSNAKQHRNVATVRVTVFDKGGSTATATGSINSFTGAASIQSRPGTRSSVLDLPVIRLTPSSKKNAPSYRSTAPFKRVHLSAESRSRNTVRRATGRPSQVRERRIAND